MNKQPWIPQFPLPPGRSSPSSQYVNHHRVKSAGRVEHRQLADFEILELERIFQRSRRVPDPNEQNPPESGNSALEDISAVKNKHSAEEEEDPIMAFLETLEGVNEESKPQGGTTQALIPYDEVNKLKRQIRLVEQANEELRLRLSAVERHNRKLINQLNQRSKKYIDMEEELQTRRRGRPVNPVLKRLRQVGIDTPELRDLTDQWAGFVLGRLSMAMEVEGVPYKEVFGKYADSGVITERAFKSIVKQFEPQIKPDQLTRLWFFADADGSGQLDLLEFMRIFGADCNGDMSDEYADVVLTCISWELYARGGLTRVYSIVDKDQNGQWDNQELNEFLNYLKLPLTQREADQIFKRMVTSLQGVLTIIEFEEALENATNRCCASEAVQILPGCNGKRRPRPPQDPRHKQKKKTRFG